MAFANSVGPDCSCCGGGGGTVIDPPCLDGVTNPEATYSGHLSFQTPGGSPPFPTMDVTFFPNHFVDTFGNTFYQWDTGLIKFPPGSAGLSFFGDNAYFSLGVACSDPRPDAGLYQCEGPPEDPEPCTLQDSDTGTPLVDPVDGPVVLYTTTGIVLSGFHGGV